MQVNQWDSLTGAYANGCTIRVVSEEGDMVKLSYLEGYTRDTAHPGVQQVQNTVFCLDLSPNPLHDIHSITKFGFDRSLARQKLHEDHSEAVDITLFVYLQCVCVLCNAPQVNRSSNI